MVSERPAHRSRDGMPARNSSVISLIAAQTFFISYLRLMNVPGDDDPSRLVTSIGVFHYRMHLIGVICTGDTS